MKELKQSEIKELALFSGKTGINIYQEMYGMEGGINWPGKGTKSIKETEEFIKQLQTAIKYYKKFYD